MQIHKIDDSLACLAITNHVKVFIMLIKVVIWMGSKDCLCFERSHAWKWHKYRTTRTSQSQYFTCKFCSFDLCHNFRSIKDSRLWKSEQSYQASSLVERQNGCKSIPPTCAFLWTFNETKFPYLQENHVFMFVCESSTKNKLLQPKPQEWARNLHSSKSTSQFRSPKTHVKSADFSWFQQYQK